MKYFFLTIILLFGLISPKYSFSQSDCNKESYENCVTVLPSLIPCDANPGSCRLHLLL